MTLHCRSCGAQTRYHWDWEYGSGPPDDFRCRACGEVAASEFDA